MTRRTRPQESGLSGRPQTWITTGARGFATRFASRSAATMSAAKKNELNPATTSKKSSS